jgi:putative ABC transport system permease protein
LSTEQIAALTRLEHVETVTPAFTWQGSVQLKDKTIAGFVRTAAEDDAGLARRIVAGRTFEPGESAMLVSEYAAYRWGLVDEEEVPSVLGRRALLKLAVVQPGVGNLLLLLNVSRPELSDEEKRLLGKLLVQLPEALTKLDLSVAERQALAKLLKQARPEAGRAVERRLPIVGVFRDVGRAELGPWDGPPRPVDVIVSPRVAKEMFFAVPGRAQAGLPQVSVRVDREENLRGVEAQIKELGLETFSLADLLDQIRVNVLLISVACTLLAAVALVVAGLGITNTMLMSVLERVHEIGVMKATGARDAQVLTLFLMEGAVLGAVGAVAGLAASWLVSFPGDRLAKHLVATQTPMKLDESVFLFSGWLVVGVPALVCLLATAAAVYPARRAARIDPIEALRQR